MISQENKREFVFATSVLLDYIFNIMNKRIIMEKVEETEKNKRN
jgi:hypothetical protein